MLHSGQTGGFNEHNNLSIIASVAAAAYFNQTLNRQSNELNSKLLSKEKSPPGVNGGPNRHLSSHHHHHHHHHPHKRAKYSTGYKTNENALSSTPAKPVSKQLSSVSYLKFIQVDTNTSPLLETLLHGERISCFIVGGEKRLCLHDILNTILKEFSVQQINSACQKLQIACLESSSKQLDILKKSQLIPTGAPNCGLLTQTNAELLCAFLMDSALSRPGPPLAASPTTTQKSRPHTMKVVHECFGKTYGHVHTHMYSKSDAACVECDTCRKLYTPKNFVCHTHKFESHIRHWGFDSANWRIYLKLAANSSASPSVNEQALNSSGDAASNPAVLSDIKTCNKDNIAANAANKASSQQEEFEQFKSKFLNNSPNDVNTVAAAAAAVSSSVSQQTPEATKRKMVNEDKFYMHKKMILIIGTSNLILRTQI